MKIKTLAAAAVLSLVTGQSIAAEKIELGLLTCDIEGGVGFLIGSKKDLTCVFEYANSRRPDDLYTGSVKKFGLDVGVTGRAVVKWVVLGANVDAAKPGSLGGDYVGLSATASAGIGVGANALVGGSNDGFILQPFSLEGSEGVNVAVGFSKFELKAVN